MAEGGGVKKNQFPLPPEKKEEKKENRMGVKEKG